MLIAMHPVDYAVLALYAAIVLAIGFYSSPEQRSTREYFLAGRSMGWFPVGLSLTATLVSGLTYFGVAGEAYQSGFKFLALPFGLWLTLPVMLGVVLPVYRGLGICSVFEYLEKRFDSKMRIVGSLLFLAWRTLGLGAILLASSKLLVLAAGIHMPLWVVLVLTGIVTMTYTCLGGIKGVIWADTIHACLMMCAGAIMILAIWWRLEGGPKHVWDVASQLSRTLVLELPFRWDSAWTFWGIVPHYFLLMLSFFISDQIFAQRCLTVRSLGEAQRSFMLTAVATTAIISLLAYVGLCLLVLYHEHPEVLRAKWVLNVDTVTRQSLTYADREGAAEAVDPLAKRSSHPLLDWDEPRDEVTASTIRKLVREGRILKPNSQEPFASADELFDPSEPEALDIRKLVTRQPPKPGMARGEIILHARAQDELMPWFIAHHLPWGLAGLVVAGVLAATISSVDAGLNSMCTLLVVDLQRHWGWGRKWLAKRLHKSPSAWTEADEMWLARPLTVAVAVAAMFCSLLVAQMDDLFGMLLETTNTLGAPLLGIFLLGLFTRRGTAAGAVLALGVGMAGTFWMMLANKYPAWEWLWPFEQKIHSIWPFTFGVLFTFAIGYLASLVCGRRKSVPELRGLVLGVGRLGQRS